MMDASLLQILGKAAEFYNQLDNIGINVSPEAETGFIQEANHVCTLRNFSENADWSGPVFLIHFKDRIIM